MKIKGIKMRGDGRMGQSKTTLETYEVTLEPSGKTDYGKGRTNPTGCGHS